MGVMESPYNETKTSDVNWRLVAFFKAYAVPMYATRVGLHFDSPRSRRQLPNSLTRRLASIENVVSTSNDRLTF
jgi:hypothetical protein